jgi:LuxR family maltose regulon positive regulatory protein
LAASFDGDSHAVVLADEAIALSERLSPRCRWVAANAYLALATVRLATGSVRGARQAVNQTLTALAGIPEHLEQRTRAHALELLEKVGRGDGPGRPVEVRDLSARERRVLNALCSSLTLREIADELCVSHNTVKSQVSSIFRKLSVHDRAAAVAAARSRASGRP